MARIITTFILALSLTVSAAFAHQWCWCCDQSNTYGWQLMTPDERKEHQARLDNFTEYSACKEYIDEHHKKMEERARGKDVVEPQIKKNPCDGLKERGKLK